jgi:hypothetical protein
MENLENEVWRIIVGCSTHSVSSMGRIKRNEHFSYNKHKTLEFREERLMHIRSNTKEGYIRVCLNINGNRKLYPVHRLVATAFIANHENKPQVNHIDNNPSNNKVTNLEWCTPKENVSHCLSQGRGRKVARRVRCLNTGRIYSSVTELAIALNKKPNTVLYIIRRGAHGGYEFVSPFREVQQDK